MIVEVMKVWRYAAFQMGVLECRVEVWTAFEAIKDKKQCLPCKSRTFHKFTIYRLFLHFLAHRRLEWHNRKVQKDTRAAKVRAVQSSVLLRVVSLCVVLLNSTHVVNHVRGHDCSDDLAAISNLDPKIFSTYMSNTLECTRLLMHRENFKSFQDVLDIPYSLQNDFDAS